MKLIIIFICMVAVGYALRFVSNMLMKKKIAKQPPISPALKFANGTYAIISELNLGNYNLLASQLYETSTKTAAIALLKNGWGTTGKDNGLEMAESLVNGRHNPNFLEEVKNTGIDSLSRTEFANLLSSINEPKSRLRFKLLHDAYQEFGENAIAAWDLSRANEVLSLLYLANFIDKDSYIKNTLEVSARIQNIYSSWDSYIKSYMYGYQYWSGDDPETDSKKIGNYQHRLKVIKKLKDDINSPYHLDWNTSLKD